MRPIIARAQVKKQHRRNARLLRTKAAKAALMPSRLKYWLPLAIYSGIIFYLSGISSIELPGVLPFDKFAHLFEYFLWGFFAVFALKNSFKLEKSATFIVTMLAGVAFSVFDEIHQLFIPGIMFSYFDLGFDFIGVFCMLSRFGENTFFGKVDVELAVLILGECRLG